MDIVEEMTAAFTESEMAQHKQQLADIFSAHVSVLNKSGELILAQLTPELAELWHMGSGVATEGGELLDAIKKLTCYNKPLNITDPKTGQTIRENIIEELGDLEFFMEKVRQLLSISREETLLHNINKLKSRYPQGYSDAAAQERADKVTGVLVTNPPAQQEEVPQAQQEN